MRVYISGPISGIENGNKESFEQAADAVRDCGDTPVNPHEVGASVPRRFPEWDSMTERAQWNEYMKADLAAMLGCDEVVALEGWRNSRGAVDEISTALRYGMRVYGLDE